MGMSWFSTFLRLICCMLYCSIVARLVAASGLAYRCRRHSYDSPGCNTALTPRLLFHKQTFTGSHWQGWKDEHQTLAR